MLRATWSIEYDDALSDAKDVLRHLHAGVEWNYGDAVFARVGGQSTLLDAGPRVRVRVFTRLQLATYGEEIGTADQPREDRRGVGKISWRF